MTEQKAISDKVTVVQSEEFPDTTYFLTGDVEPVTDKMSITVYEGAGTRRSWGRPRVGSRVLSTNELLVVHVGFSHKHGGGQFWRYYGERDGCLEQVRWVDLPDEIRQEVIDLAEKYGPKWAKSPGKLCAERDLSHTEKVVGYKIVRIIQGEMHSLYDSSVIYEIGKLRAERALLNHGGGYYVYTRGPQQLIQDFLTGSVAGIPGLGEYGVLECICWGHPVTYSNDKVAHTYCQPTELLKTFKVIGVNL